MKVKQKIINAIINKGGLMGYAAKMYINDEKNAHQFIIDCSDQCHNPNAKDFWGEYLVSEILRYKQETINLNSKAYEINRTF